MRKLRCTWFSFEQCATRLQSFCSQCMKESALGQKLFMEHQPLLGTNPHQFLNSEFTIHLLFQPIQPLHGLMLTVFFFYAFILIFWHICYKLFVWADIRAQFIGYPNRHYFLDDAITNSNMVFTALKDLGKGVQNIIFLNVMCYSLRKRTTVLYLDCLWVNCYYFLILYTT